MKLDTSIQKYAFLALLAAALFGASTPVAKQLIGAIAPILLAGLLYLGSGLGLSVIWMFRKRPASLPRGKDWLWVVGALAAGGIAAPLLLVYGLASTSAGSAVLLLNLEGVLTAAVASLFFREAVGARVWMAGGVMLIAAGILGHDPQAAFGISGSAAMIVAACLMWAIDNNMTRMASAADALFLALVKGLGAGAFNVGLAFAIGSYVPELESVAIALLVGFLGYGLSLVLFIMALRHLGSARTAAHFATAPFFGSAVAVLFLKEPLTPHFGIAVLLMAIATYLVLTEKHEHRHAHERVIHEHLHVHDEHHQHAHEGESGPEPHSHVHEHEPLTHAHSHLPDIHHRHRH